MKDFFDLMGFDSSYIIMLILIFILTIISAALKGYAKYTDKRLNQERKELLKWQMELEKKSSEIRRQTRDE